MMELLIADHPREEWEAIRGRLDSEDALASHGLAGRLSINKSAREGVPLLNNLPADTYLEWMEEKPRERIPDF